MLRCPRCGYALPYWRSRRWRLRLGPPGVAFGRRCPRCGRETARNRSPLWLKPLRLLLGQRCSYRECGCGWRGAAFHGASQRYAGPE